MTCVIIYECGITILIEHVLVGFIRSFMDEIPSAIVIFLKSEWKCIIYIRCRGNSGITLCPNLVDG